MKRAVTDTWVLQIWDTPRKDSAVPLVATPQFVIAVVHLLHSRQSPETAHNIFFSVNGLKENQVLGFGNIRICKLSLQVLCQCEEGLIIHNDRCLSRVQALGGMLDGLCAMLIQHSDWAVC